MIENQTLSISQFVMPLSRRAVAYNRDKSKRGRALVLANILENLKKHSDFIEFQDEMIAAITAIRDKSRATPETMEAKVLQVLREFPSTLDEIIEDTRLPRKETVLIIKSLLLKKIIVEKQQPRFHEAGEHFTAFYQLKS